MKAKEAVEVFELAKERGLCNSLRGFAKCLNVVPSSVSNWINNPDRDLRGDIVIKLDYLKEELERKDTEYVDWGAFRRNAAKDILCAIMQHDNLGREADGYKFKEAAVSIAIIFADELVKQLKVEKK